MTDVNKFALGISLSLRGKRANFIAILFHFSFEWNGIRRGERGLHGIQSRVYFLLRLNLSKMFRDLYCNLSGTHFFMVDDLWYPIQIHPRIRVIYPFTLRTTIKSAKGRR